jgi:hypothetical protein
VLVGDDDGLGDVPELLEVAPHRVALRLPRQATNEQLRERCVAVHRWVIAGGRSGGGGGLARWRLLWRRAGQWWDV